MVNIVPRKKTQVFFPRVAGKRLTFRLSVFTNSSPNFQNRRGLPEETGKKNFPRYYRNMGLGFKTFKEAMKGTYTDKMSFTGVVTKKKMPDFLLHPQENCFKKHHNNLSVHL